MNRGVTELKKSQTTGVGATEAELWIYLKYSSVPSMQLALYCIVMFWETVMTSTPFNTLYI